MLQVIYSNSDSMILVNNLEGPLTGD